MLIKRDVGVTYMAIVMCMGAYLDQENPSFRLPKPWHVTANNHHIRNAKSIKFA
jgi:hypothetical protein